MWGKTSQRKTSHPHGNEIRTQILLGEKLVSARKKRYLVTHYRPHSEGCGKVIFSLCPSTGVEGVRGAGWVCTPVSGPISFPSLWSQVLSGRGAATPIRSKILPSLWSQVLSRGYPMVSGSRSLPWSVVPCPFLGGEYPSPVQSPAGGGGYLNLGQGGTPYPGQARTGGTSPPPARKGDTIPAPMAVRSRRYASCVHAGGLYCWNYKPSLCLNPICGRIWNISNLFFFNP